MQNITQEHVKLMAEMFGKLNHGKETLYGLFDKAGKPGNTEPLDEKEQAIIDDIVNRHGGKRYFKMKECYCNAQRLATYDKRLKYHEGYIMSKTLPIAIQHSWVTLNGKVVDLTREALVRNDPKREDEEWHYFGVEVKTLLVMRNALMTKIYSPVTENHELAPKVWGKIWPKEQKKVR
jgi:hypothetical protein